MKTCVIEVSIDESQKSALGNRWKDGKTIVFLKPVHPLFWGKWNSNRPSDIDSAGGSEHAIYIWKQPFWGSSAIYLKTVGYDGDTEDRTVLKFDNFESWKIHESGDGVFCFRGEEWNIYWDVVRFE